MSLFIDKHNRRKSPLALAAFGAALLYLCVFGVLYALLAEPLYRYVRLDSAAATVAVHSAAVAAVGTAVCCLLFLLEDKRVAPLGFAGLAVVLGMFYAAALMLEAEERSLMLQLITMYGLAPVLAGNAAAWPLYLKIRREGSLPNDRKTLQQELMEAAAEEAVKRERKKTGRPEEAAKLREEPSVSPGAAKETGPVREEERPSRLRSVEEEAMLLYMDDDDEESDD